MEFTETTLVLMAAAEGMFDVLLPLGELLEHPAHAAAATTKTAIQPIRTAKDRSQPFSCRSRRRRGRESGAVQVRQTPATERWAPGGQESWGPEKDPAASWHSGGNGPGVRRGRDAAIRLLQGNARVGRYHGPPALLPAFSPEWVISLAIHRSIFNQLLHPGEGLAPGSTPPARASSRVSSPLLLNCLGADGTP